MALVVKGIYDGKTLKLLEPLELTRPHWVDVTLREEVAADEVERARRRERILSYAGIWLDFSDEDWAALMSTT
jgi:hypothetical protein